MKKLLVLSAIVTGFFITAIGYTYLTGKQERPPRNDTSSSNQESQNQSATETQSNTSDNQAAQDENDNSSSSAFLINRVASTTDISSGDNSIGQDIQPQEPALYPPGRYRNSVFDSVESHKDITYKSTFHTELISEGDGYRLEDNESSPVDLKLNVYQPSGDTQTKRPLLIFVYGGGWIDGDRYQQESAAIDFARRGYVTITIDYTMLPPGNELNPVPDTDGTVYPQLIYKSAYNIYEAYNWALQHKAMYRIDESRIGLAGWSAGGMISQTLGHIIISAPPVGIMAILGASNILPEYMVNLPPLGGMRTFTPDYHPVSMFASYDDDDGFAGSPNDHAADCAYLNGLGHECNTITFAGTGHDLWFDQPPIQQHAIDFFASNVAE